MYLATSTDDLRLTTNDSEVFWLLVVGCWLLVSSNILPVNPTTWSLISAIGKIILERKRSYMSPESFFIDKPALTISLSFWPQSRKKLDRPCQSSGANPRRNSLIVLSVRPRSFRYASAFLPTTLSKNS